MDYPLVTSVASVAPGPRLQEAPSACAPAKEPPEFPWPAGGVELPGAHADASFHLTRQDGEAIRCALLAHFAKPETRAAIAEPFASRASTWDVGSPWMSGDGPRIDLYGLAAGDAPNELVLTHTLSVTEGGRYSIRAHVVPATGGAGWVVTSFGEVIAHRARR